jgi:phosphatidylglycerophosphatase C
MTSASRPVRRVVFDLDGVIARDDTMAVLIQRRLVSHPIRAALGVFPAAGWYLLRGVPALRVRMSRALGRAALSGLDAAQYRDLAVAVGVELGRNPKWTIADGLAAARAHIAAGDDVVVTTGTEESLARAFLDEIGLPGIPLIATTLGFRRRRVHYENHNLGSRKVANFGPNRIDVFYTDSELDLRLAESADRTILVNPTNRLARRFRTRIAQLEIVRWG